MGGRAGGGARGASGRSSGSSLQSLGKAVVKAFYSKGVESYIDGSTSASAAKAYANYQKKLSDFQKAYKAANNGDGPAFDRWLDLASGFASGDFE